MAPKQPKPDKPPKPNEKCTCPGQPKPSGKKAKKCCFTPAKVGAQQSSKPTAEADKYFCKACDAYTGDPPDYPAAFRFNQRAAEMGHMEAQCSLGEMLHTGKGCAAIDEPLALKWYSKAAAQGDALAMFNVGQMHQHGWPGQAPSAEKAAANYLPAAKKGYVHAQYNLGVLLGDGNGVPQDDAQAVSWYRKAAAQGCAMSKLNLSHMLAAGRGVDTADPTAKVMSMMESMMNLSEAADAGNEGAKVSVAQNKLAMAQHAGGDEMAVGKATKEVREAMNKALDSQARGFSYPHMGTQLDDLKLSRTCDACGKTEAQCQAADDKLRYCGGCKLAKYCSPECMSVAWPKHKAKCASEQEARAAREAE